MYILFALYNNENDSDFFYTIVFNSFHSVYSHYKITVIL